MTNLWVANLGVIVLAVATAGLFIGLWMLDASRAQHIEHDGSRRDTAPHPDDWHPLPVRHLGPRGLDDTFEGGLGVWGHHVWRSEERRQRQRS
ncbi:hypothetical protein [Nocardioides sp. Kera G14]|uniref:hypothetical protein n=1 Tax=Nocardioides sp. Kera G14 TaxID=2884264 RepID=UPI001D10C2B6|nr:hypothetical protein [Nocardioides sp. Kera G14]UDY24645.1 hypothetical protein LH076_04890 [Nocardioides sp. Kera G14]